MHVFPYLSDLTVQKLNWSEKRVAAEGIHPWQIDLFDPNPLLIKDGDRELRFKRLEHIGFGFFTAVNLTAPRQAILCTRVRGVDTCVQVRVKQKVLSGAGPGGSHTDFDRAEAIPQSFEDLFAEYLRRIYESRATEMVFEPFAPDSLVYRGNSSFRLDLLPERDARELAVRVTCQYVGEMFRAITFSGMVPQWLREVLRILRPLNATISGPEARRLALGQKVEKVKITATAVPTREMNAELKAIGFAMGATFVYGTSNGARFEVETGTARDLRRPGESALAISENSQRWKEQAELKVCPERGLPATSADDVFIHGEQMCVSRIAAHDLDTRLIRRLEHVHPVVREEHTPDSVQMLLEEGFHTQHDPLSPWHIMDGCHCDPTLPFLAESIRQATCRGQLGAGEELGGISPGMVHDWVETLACKAIQQHRLGKRKCACVTSFEVHRMMFQWARDNHAFDITGTTLLLMAFAKVQPLWRERLSRVFHLSLLSDPEWILDSVQKMYLENLQATMVGAAHVTAGQPVRTGFVEEIEKYAGISSATVHRFRTEVIIVHDLVVRTHGRVRYNCHATLAKAYEKYVIGQQKDLASFVITGHDVKLEQQLLRNLTTQYGYCEHCAQALLHEARCDRDFFK